MQYGIVDWAVEEELRNYQGDIVEDLSVFERFYNKIGKCANKLSLFFGKNKKKKVQKYKAYLDAARTSMVDSRDTKLAYLKQKHLAFGTEATFSAVQVEENYRRNVEDFFAKFNERFEIKSYLVSHVVHFDCLRTTVNAMQNFCPALWDEYTLKYVKNLYTACELTHDSALIENYIKSSC